MEYQLSKRTWREKARAFQENSAFYFRYPVKACRAVARPRTGRGIPYGVGASHSGVHLGTADSAGRLPHPCPLPPTPAPRSTQYQPLHLLFSGSWEDRGFGGPPSSAPKRTGRSTQHRPSRRATRAKLTATDLVAPTWLNQISSGTE